jgi:pyridoxine kinase
VATILAISSQVARGSVGLSVITPALQAIGHSVIALPTILLSNHPGHGTFAGQRTEVALLTRMCDALDANGWLASIDTILSGYLPSPAHVGFVAQTVDCVRRCNPACRYICDPILGDDPKGLYIAADAAAEIRRLLLPLADVVMPNRFELAWLSGLPVTSPADAVAAAQSLSTRTVIATSITLPEGVLATLEIEQNSARFCSVARRASVPNGTGDLLSGLIAGSWNLGRAVAAVDVVITASAGHDELQLAPARATWINAKPLTEKPLAVL